MTDFTFTVSRSPDINRPSSVGYVVEGYGANPANAADFVGGVFPSGTIEFDVDEASKTLTIQVNADAALEADESFKVTLVNPVNGNIATGFAIGIIQNDEFVLPTSSIAATDASKVLSASVTTEFSFTVTRTGSTTGTSSVDYAVTGSGGNPAVATDFTGNAFPSGTVNFGIGESSKPVSIEVKAGLEIVLNKGFTVTLSNPIDSIIGTSVANGTMIPYLETVSVPNIETMSIAEANAALLAAGLVVGTITNEGAVISQNPAASTVVAINSSVNYTCNMSAISAINVTQNSATIAATFNENSQGQTEYGTTQSYGTLSNKENSFNYSSHQQQLSNLAPNTIYNYRFHGWNQGGVHSISNNRTFQTQPAITPYVYATITGNEPTINVTAAPYNCVGNGIANCTAGIQAAINACPAGGVVYIPAGVFMTSTVNLKSNMTLLLHDNAVLKKIPDGPAIAQIQNLIYGSGLSNIQIVGGTLQGDGFVDNALTIAHNPTATFVGSISGTVLNVSSVSQGSIIYNIPSTQIVADVILGGTTILSSAGGSGGAGNYNINRSQSVTSRTIKEYCYEAGMTIALYSCNNVVIEDVYSKDAFCDGLYVGGTGLGGSNYRIYGCTFDNARRQGSSLIAADGIIFNHCTFSNTLGVPPGCGVDVEPNSGCTVRNSQFLYCNFLNNNRPGAVGLELFGGTGFVTNVTIDHCVASGNASGGYGIYNPAGRVTGVVATNNTGMFNGTYP